MSFYGSSFSFDGISCEEYGLMLYELDSNKMDATRFATLEVHEERLYQRPRALFYGASHQDPLEFRLVFGAGEYEAAQNIPLDRQDLEVISAWLMKPDGYKWLTIDQPDMEGLRYRCVITELEVIEIALQQWAFQCTVHCDSPYAYTLPLTYTYVVNGSAEVTLHSRSSANVPYYPTLTIVTSGRSFSITNLTEGSPGMILQNLPFSSDTLTIDGERGVMTSEEGANVYKCSNFKFPSLIPGDNFLKITGFGTVTFTCEFPVSIGG